MTNDRDKALLVEFWRWSRAESAWSADKVVDAFLAARQPQDERDVSVGEPCTPPAPLPSDVAQTMEENARLNDTMRRLTERNVEVRLQRDALLAAAKRYMDTVARYSTIHHVKEIIDLSALRTAVEACK